MCMIISLLALPLAVSVALFSNFVVRLILVIVD